MNAIHLLLNSRFQLGVRATMVLVPLAWRSPAYCGEIHRAAASGDLDRVETLFKDNPELIFSKENNGNTPLLVAADQGRKEVAQLLLASKADVNAKNNAGETPLHRAADKGQMGVAKLLLVNKADLNAKDDVGGTPLHQAAFTGHTDVAELLLASKADVNAMDDNLSGKSQLGI